MTRLYWNEKPKYDNQELIEIALFIYDMKNPGQSISPDDNFFVYVPPAREKESHKILAIFYRTASQGKIRERSNQFQSIIFTIIINFIQKQI